MQAPDELLVLSGCQVSTDWNYYSLSSLKDDNTDYKATVPQTQQQISVNFCRNTHVDEAMVVVTDGTNKIKLSKSFDLF